MYHLPVLEDKFKIKASAGLCLLKPASLACRWLSSLCVFMWSFFWNICVLIFYKDIGHNGLGPLGANNDLILLTPLKVLSPSKITF